MEHANQTENSTLAAAALAASTLAAHADGAVADGTQILTCSGPMVAATKGYFATSLATPFVRTLEAPDHGTFETEIGEGFTTFKQDSKFAKCNDKQMSGTSLFYNQATAMSARTASRC